MIYDIDLITQKLNEYRINKYGYDTTYKDTSIEGYLTSKFDITNFKNHNNYCYEFDYRFKHVKFCDQGTRFIVTVCNIDIPHEIYDAINYLVFMNESLYNEIVNEFKFKEFIVNFNSSINSIELKLCYMMNEYIITPSDLNGSKHDI